ncbi:MAG: acyl carrier protein [Myxococcales bacterium]|nr:acyl carrier protein [Myxococcales bacterium]
MSTTSPSALKEDIRAIIAEVSEVDDIPDDKAFQDLGIDSMMAIEIVAEVERKYKISVPEEELQQLTNLQKVYELVQTKL